MSKSKYTDMKNDLNKQNNVRQVAQRNAELENIREGLLNLILEYKAILGKSTLIQNLTQPDRQKLGKLMEGINSMATELSNKNLGEGALVLGAAGLNSVLLLHEEINQLKYHNFFLTKRVEVIEEANKIKEPIKE